MSDIVLSASVRQNLLSLQSTADLLATTQTRLATGKKVNTALDNPTNFFTAAGLDARASDINNLLDGIGNGVQVLQAANTGITSLQKLIDTAKSIANQALQTQVGYTKSYVKTAANAGANGSNILGTSTAATAGTVTAGAFSPINVSATGSGSPTSATIAEAASSFTGPLNVSGTGSTLAGTGTYAAMDFSGAGTLSFDLSFDGGTSTQSISIAAADISAAGGTPSATTSQADVVAALNAKINTAFGTSGVTYASVSGGGTIDINSGDFAGSSTAVEISNYAATGTGGTSTIANGNGSAGTSANNLHFDIDIDGSGAPTTVTIDQDAVNAYNTANSTSLDASNLSGADIALLVNDQISGGTVAFDSGTSAMTFTSATSGTSSGLEITNTGVAGTTTNTTGIADHALTNGSAAGVDASMAFTVTVDGGTPKNVVISKATVDAYNTAKGASFSASSLSASNIAAIVNYQVGSNVASTSAGSLVFKSPTTGAGSSIDVSAVTTAGAATGSTGIVAGNDNGADGSGGLNGTTLTIASTGGGSATSITFGTGPGEISTINQLNAALLPNNLQASIDTTGAITITTSNDAASSTVGALGGTATDPGGPFAGLSIEDPILDPNSQATRANLVSQYNNIINQIKTTSQDASFNGVNLLNGDQLKLIFNETGKSTLNITGVNLDPAGLGLGALTSGVDFVDNVATNKVLDSLNYASSFLRSQASTLGSNLSIVQIRQDFSKQLINVLQSGSTNLTIADTNEEAANSQALSTRQSIAVSALALANQSQQSVLKLLQ